MVYFLYFISVAWIAIGSCMILYTSQTRMFAKEFIARMHPALLALFPLISGLLFILAASASSHPWTIRLFGVIGILKGVFVYLNPQDLHQQIMDWYFEHLSDQAHRFIGILTVILGTALLSWILP